MRTTIALLMATLVLSACGGSAQETELTTAATEVPTDAPSSEAPSSEAPSSDDPATEDTATEEPSEPSSPGADAATPGSPSDEASESVLDGVGGDPARVPTTEVTGTLGGDAALEGGCAWIDGPDGRYEVQYPEGYTVEYDPVRLLGPDGEVVAQAGDTLTITGAPAEAMMSICQVGQLFTADTVQPS